MPVAPVGLTPDTAAIYLLPLRPEANDERTGCTLRTWTGNAVKNMTPEERINELVEYWTDQLELANQEIQELRHRVKALEDKVHD